MDSETGKRVKQRRVDLGMSVKGLAERAGVDRATLTALEAGSTSVRESTVGAIEAALSKLEHEMGMDEPPSKSERPLVEIEVRGDTVIVRGPVEDRDALAEMAAELMRRAREGGEGRN